MTLFFIFTTRQHSWLCTALPIAHPSVCLSHASTVSQESWTIAKTTAAMRPIYGCPEKFQQSWLATATFPEISNGFLFRPILRMCVQNWKCVALPVPNIIGVLEKFWQYLDRLRPRSLFSQIFKGLLFAWTLWIYLPNLKFVTLPIPEIIGGYSKKNWAVPGCTHSPFSPKFF